MELFQHLPSTMVRNMVRGRISEPILNRTRSTKPIMGVIERTLSDAEGRTRTGTDGKVRGILSPLRLPVPPPRRLLDQYVVGSCCLVFSPRRITEEKDTHQYRTVVLACFTRFVNSLFFLLWPSWNFLIRIEILYAP